MQYKLVIDKDAQEQIVVTAHKRSALTDQIEALVMQYEGNDRLYGHNEAGIRLLSFEQIECISVMEGKTYAIDTQGVHYRLKYRLYELEPMLPACFIRINKSALANENRLERFQASYSGAVDAVFKCGHTDYVSRRCFAAIKRRYDGK